MSRTVLQIPIAKRLKLDAEETANGLGFSSLQEIIRIFISKLAAKKVEISFQETTSLSPKAEARYLAMAKDIKKGRNVSETKNLNELFSLLK